MTTRGAKQAFCLLDVQQYVPGSPPARYNCGFQGITAGWADIYTSGLDCQWIDVTGVAEGDYTLELAALCTPMVILLNKWDIARRRGVVAR